MEIQNYHGTRTLCDGAWCYFDHNDKLVRASSKDSDRIQQYIGDGNWKDMSDGWSSRANFLMPGGDSMPLRDPADMQSLMKDIDARVGG